MQQAKRATRPGQHGAVLVASALAVAWMVAGCGATTDDNQGPLTVGGTLVGLMPNSSVVLQLNGAAEVTMSASGSFLFAGTLPSGSSYTVTVKEQPSGQTCTVTNGTGTITHTVSEVGVQCVETSPAITVPDTGITAAQCYAADSNQLVSCTGTEATTLSATQDGMVGRDVTVPDATDGKLGASYTKLAADGSALPVTALTWACVKDNITGRMWEAKAADGGVSDYNKTYTNRGDATDAADASAYVAAMNAAKLCGQEDWRLPTANELQAIVDYGVNWNSLMPTVDSTFFPHTAAGWYWTGTGVSGYTDVAWVVGFDYGLVYDSGRSYKAYVRLVR